MANTTIQTKPLEAANYPVIAAAVATALGGYKLFEPKLERVRAMRNEVGRLETGFRALYQWPQWVLILLSSVLFAYLVAAFFETLHPGALNQAGAAAMPRALFAPETTIWVIVLIPIIGGVIYWNGVPRALMLASRLLTVGRVGPHGGNVGWHQTASVIEGPDKGQPLLIDREAIDRVAWNVLAKLVKGAGAKDYAAEPRLPVDVKANIALFGCILEATHYAQRWPSPDWAKFYSALASIQSGPNPIFAHSQLNAFANGQAFFEALRGQLDRELTARAQPVPPDRGLAAAADVAGAWKRLTERAKGDVSTLVPKLASLIGGKVVWMDRRLRRFPRLNDEGMRPQLIKLLMRWHVLPVTAGVFTQPFSRDQAWLLLQEGVIRALPEQKEVTFHGTGQIGIARVAALRVVERVAELIDQGDSSEASAAASMLGAERWDRLEAADFALWSWAHAANKDAAAANWDNSKWRWRLEGGRAFRQS